QMADRNARERAKPWVWQEQQVFLEESKGRLYSNIKSEPLRPDLFATNGTITVDGAAIRWDTDWSEAVSWILVGDVKGFPIGVVTAHGAYSFRYLPMYDRYLKNIGYILTNPYDRAFTVEYEPTDIRFIPNCFQKAKYTVAKEREEVD